MNKKQLSQDWLGSVSQATLRNSDLLDAYTRLADDIVRKSNLDQSIKDKLDNQAKKIYKLLEHFPADKLNYNEQLNHICYNELQVYLDLFNRIAPEDCHFGANEGDGADFGFWPNWNQLKEEEIQAIINN